MNNRQNETIYINEKALEFSSTTVYPKKTLPKGIIILLPAPNVKAEAHINSFEDLADSGFITTSISPPKTFVLGELMLGVSALIDKLRRVYKFLPIIICADELATVGARELAYKESERIAGVLLIHPSLARPSGISIIGAKLISVLKGKDFCSPMLGNNNIPLSCLISYYKKLKELDAPEKISEYPKYIPTLIVNSDNDVLFDALDDAYVSELQKISCDPSEIKAHILAFSESVVSGVGDAMTSSSFIYGGTNQ